MYCLFLDIAFGEGVFALFSDGASLEQQKCGLVESRQPTLIFDTFLKRRNLSLEDISFIACGVGPGSYTGIRSANAIARGISFCTNKKIVAVPSLLLFVPETKGEYLLLANAGVGGVYGQKIVHDGVSCHFEAPALLSREAVKDCVGCEKIASSAEWLQEEGVFLRVVRSHVNVVGTVAYDLYHQGKVYDAHTLPLLYLRKTQAELESEKIYSKRS